MFKVKFMCIKSYNVKEWIIPRQCQTYEKENIFIYCQTIIQDITGLETSMNLKGTPENGPWFERNDFLKGSFPEHESWNKLAKGDNPSSK